MLKWLRMKYVGLYGRLHTRWYERRLNIDTSGYMDPNVPDAKAYISFHYTFLFSILRHANLRSDDVVVDIGCGKGRVVCCAARSAVRSAIGVEIDSGLCAIANQNAARLRTRRSPITIHNLPAQDYDYADATLLFLFNPFGAQTLQATLARVEQSLRANPRPLRIVYVNPVHESVLESLNWLECQERWPGCFWTTHKFPVSFWRSRM